MDLYEFLRNDGTKNSFSNAEAVRKGYNPYIPGDIRHDLVNSHKNYANEIVIVELKKLLTINDKASKDSSCD